MRFGSPEYLNWLSMVVVYAAISLSADALQRRRRKSLGKHLDRLALQVASTGRRRVKLILKCIGLSLLVIALARPQIGKGLQEIRVRGVELAVVLDLSTSMLAEDLKPSRLSYAKSELNRLFDLMSGDKVALLGFAGSTVLFSPLTSDVAALKMYLDSVSPFSIQNQGTDFKKALEEAAAVFDRGGVDDDDHSKTTRVVLILSDGEDQEKGALDLAKKLGRDGVRIFTIAFGTEKGGMIPLRDERGFLRGYKKDKNGKEVITAVKGDFLRQLAEAGQGAFRFATAGGSEAKEIKGEIDQLQKTEFQSTVSAQFEEKFQWFLAVGIFILIVELLIKETGKLAGNSLLSRISKQMLLVFVLNALGGSQGVCSNLSDEIKARQLNQQGIKSLEKGNNGEALKVFSQVIGKKPDSEVVHYNLGTTFLANQENEKSESELNLAVQSSASTEIRFAALFNRAWAKYNLKRTDEALADLREALKLKPNSVEVRKNIEMFLANSQQGSGGDKDQKDQKNQEQNQNQNQNQNQQPQTGPTPKPTPKPFKSEQLSQQDVSKILEEIKRQEDEIRERMQREKKDNGKETSREKDW